MSLDAYTSMKKQTVYSYALPVWFVLVAGITFLAYSGLAEPVISRSQLPQGPLYMFVVPAAAVVAGVIVLSFLRQRSWLAMGRKADLTAEDGGLLPFGRPTLSGTVRGRPVRARTMSIKQGGGDQGSNKKTFTVIEADLSERAEAGTILGRSDGGRTDPEKAEFGSVSIANTVVDEQFVAAESTTDVAESVLTGRARQSLLDLDEFGTVLVGNASGTLQAAVPDMGDSMLGGFIEGKFEKAIAGDAGTVSHQLDSGLYDPAELRRQVEAMAAVADAFEDATGTK